MKTKTMLSVMMIMAFSALFISSCKKDKGPEYPQLEGAWLQVNSTDSIYFYVADKSGTLYITEMKVRVFNGGGMVRYQMSNSDGLTAIASDNSFSILIENGGLEGPTDIGGTFNPTSMVLMGNFHYYTLGDTNRITLPFTISRP
jgi:hypothetical protein